MLPKIYRYLLALSGIHWRDLVSMEIGTVLPEVELSIVASV